MLKTKDLRHRFRDCIKSGDHKLLISHARFQLLIRISARSIAGINLDDRDPMLARNVREFEKERRERPAVLNQSLLLSNPDATSDMLQVLNGDSRTPGIDSLFDNAARDVPQLLLNRPMLFTRQPFERPPPITTFALPFRFSLQRATLTKATATNLLNSPAVKGLSRRSEGYAIDTAISLGCNAFNNCTSRFLRDEKIR